MTVKDQKVNTGKTEVCMGIPDYIGLSKKENDLAGVSNNCVM